MNNAVTKVAVVESGISGAVCASTLARNGVPVTLFESARGPGGRMSQRRESIEDGKELLLDHGAPFFSISKSEELPLVQEWESRGLIAEWQEKFGSFDFCTRKFTDIEQEGLSKRYVGVPGMNSICKALCNENGVESKFGVTIGKIEWSDVEHLWALMGLDGQILGQFKGIVGSDKNIVSPRFTEVSGRLPPLGGLIERAVSQAVLPIVTDGFFIQQQNMQAETIIAQTGLKKPSDTALKKVADELFQEFQSVGLNKSQPFFKKAHRCQYVNGRSK